MKNSGGTQILTNLVAVHPRNIHTKHEANLCRGLGEVDKVNKSCQKGQHSPAVYIT